MQTDSSHPARGRHWVRWLLLAAIAAASFAAVIIPAWYIQPFKLQTPGILTLSYTLRHWSPVVTVVALAAAILLIFYWWKRTHRWWRKATLFLPLFPLLLAAWFARQNHFEWLFKPLPNAAFAKASEASFVADDDLVLAVELNGESAAYPVRQIAYHHVVQDIIGGSPVAVTY